MSFLQLLLCQYSRPPTKMACSSLQLTQENWEIPLRLPSIKSLPSLLKVPSLLRLRHPPPPRYYEYTSQDLCLLLEKGRYKFKIFDDYYDGTSYCDPAIVDYSLQYDGQLLEKQMILQGVGMQPYFGEGSCCEKGQKLVELKINLGFRPR